jgi:predicted permease
MPILRSLVRDWRTTVTALVMLSLGLGANVALVTVINAAFVRPLPYPEPEHLVFLHASFPNSTESDWANFSYADYQDLAAASRSYEQIAVHSDFSSLALDGREGPARVQANFIEGAHFDTLGAEPALGRALTGQELREGAPAVVLSDGAWRRLFGADPAIVGQAIRLNGLSCTVVGVMSASFHDLAERSGTNIDLWLPLATAPRLVATFNLQNRGGRVMWGVARLKPGVTVEAADAEAAAIGRRLEALHPDTNRGFGLHAIALSRVYFPEMRRPLALLLAGAAFVLLIVCCNVAVLLLVRGAARQRELAIRLALGATRARLVRELLAESCALAVAAGGLALAIAYAGTRALVALGGIEFPRFVTLNLDPTVVAVSVLLTIASGAVAGVLPAISGWRHAVRDRLAGTGTPQVARRPRAQAALVVIEVAAAVVLVGGAAMMARSMARLASTGLNFDSDRLLVARLDIPAHRYSQPADRARLADALRGEVGSLADVESVTLWGPSIPGRSTWVSFLAPVEREIRSPADFQMVWRHNTNAGGLRALGIRLLEGREFATTDTLDSPPVAIVSRAVAHELWPGTNPIGRRMRTGPAPTAPVATIVGIANDVSLRGRFRFDDFDPWGIPQRDVYFPFAQRPNANLVLLVRARGDAGAVAAPLREAIRRVDSTLPVYDVQTQADVLGREEQGVRFAAGLLGAYGLLALLLAAVGLYSVLAFAVSRRTREIGIRMAIGAQRSDLVRQVALNGLALALIGTLSGLAVLAGLSRVLQRFLFEVSALDSMSLAATCLILGTTAALACALPALRAASVDPLVALRQE